MENFVGQMMQMVEGAVRFVTDFFLLRTNLFNSPYAFSKKDDFFYKEHEPYGVQQKGVHSILLRIHNVWPSW